MIRTVVLELGVAAIIIRQCLELRDPSVHFGSHRDPTTRTEVAEEQGRREQHYKMKPIPAYHSFLILVQPVDQELYRLEHLVYVDEAQEIE